MSIIAQLIAQHGQIEGDNYQRVVKQLTKEERKQLADEIEELNRRSPKNWKGHDDPEFQFLIRRIRENHLRWQGPSLRETRPKLFKDKLTSRF
jgi:hypothetical protein